jgi:5-methylcytosine-specific restriction protein A
MSPAFLQYAIHAIGERVGIDVNTRIIETPEESCCEFTPNGVHRNEGFAVHFRLGWRSAEACFVPGLFSADLLTRMGQCDTEAKCIFRTFADAVSAKKVRVQMRVNGADTSPFLTESWPTQWAKLDLSLKRTPIVVDTGNDAQLEEFISDLVLPTFGMLVSLIGTEDYEVPTEGEMEGRAIQSCVTRYERKRLNREACIQLKGTRCEVCGFDFAVAYGPLGLGYIEIHHLTPVSVLGADYRIDIARDLAPLCSNCHSMAHRETPPVPLDRLRDVVSAQRQLNEVEM